MPRFLAAKPDAALIQLPWHVPLAEWPPEYLVALPRGISRHVVRFIHVGEHVMAAKEIIEPVALKEYRMLTDLHRLDVPAVDPVGVVLGRTDADGEPLDPVLLTEHLTFSLPYRALFHNGVRPDTVSRLLDAMVVLLARLHLVGFLWGDVSLSNILFRRDAGSFAAYLVDAETGELHDQLTRGQRMHDLEIASVNLFGEFSDLEAGGMLDESLDPLALVETIQSRYEELWAELTTAEEFSESELHRLEGRVRRLNALGFDVAEFDITTNRDGNTVRIQPKVVDAGHHSRRLLRLTGLDTEENQARRLLNDLDTYRAHTGQRDTPEAIVAHKWLTEVFEPAIGKIPADLRAKRDPAQFYHELLDYRWYQSQHESRDVPLLEAAEGYVRDILRNLPDEEVSEAAFQSPGDRAWLNPYDPSQGFDDDRDDTPYDPWEDGAADPGLDELGFLDIAALRAKARDS